MVDLSDHSVIRSKDRQALLFGEECPPRIRPFHLGTAEAPGPGGVKRWLARELVRGIRGQHLPHVGGFVAVAPRTGRIEGMVRICEAHPGEKRPVYPREPCDRAIRRPGGVMILFGQLVFPGLGRVPGTAGRFGLHEPEPLDTAGGPVPVEVARVVEPEWRRPEAPVPAPDLR